MAKLTAKQQKIYDFILQFTNEHGYPPSVREIGAAVGLKSLWPTGCLWWATWRRGPRSWPRSASRTI